MPFREQDPGQHLADLEERVRQLEVIDDRVGRLDRVRSFVVAWWWVAVLSGLLVGGVFGIRGCYRDAIAESHRRCREVCHLRGGRCLWVQNEAGCSSTASCACAIPASMDGGAEIDFVNAESARP